MFEELKLVVSVQHNEFDKNVEKTLSQEIVRENPHTLTIKNLESDQDALLKMGSLSSFFAESSSSMQIPLKPSAKPTRTYHFDEIVGPKYEGLHLHEKLQPQDPDEACMSTIISVSKFIPTMIDVRNHTGHHGELMFVLNDLQKLVEPQDKTAVVQVSCFSFVNGSLMNLLQTDKTQLLFNFELNYMEFSVSSPQLVFYHLREAFRKAGSTPDFRLIFFYIVLRTHKGTHKQSYLLGDLFCPFGKKKHPNQNPNGGQTTQHPFEETCRCCEGKVCSIKARYDADLSFHSELLILQKYICFNTPHREVIQEEQTNSLDIFFNELVQERNNRMVINLSLPRFSRSGPDVEVLLDFGTTIQKSVSTFNSYLFQLVHSQTRQAIPMRLTQIERSDDSRLEDLPPRPKSRRNSVFSSARKSMNNLIHLQKMNRESAQQRSQGELPRMDVESQSVDGRMVQVRHPSSSAVLQAEKPLNPFARMMEPEKATRAHSQPEFWGHQRMIEPENSQPLPQSRPDVFFGSQTKTQAVRTAATTLQQPPQIVKSELPAIDDLQEMPMDDPKRTELIVLRCFEHLQKRSDRLDVFVDYQNQLFKEFHDLTQLEFMTQKQTISTLNSIISTDQTDYEYLKHLLECVAEYKTLNDHSKKQAIKQALENNLMHLAPKHIAGLLELLGEGDNGSQRNSKDKD